MFEGRDSDSRDGNSGKDSGGCRFSEEAHLERKWVHMWRGKVDGKAALEAGATMVEAEVEEASKQCC